MTIKKGSKPQPQRKQRGIGVVVQTAQKGFRIWQSFGMRGKYFASGLIVREGVEAALQTIQASSSANQISNPFVNYSYAVLIFINCCSSYLYGFLFRADHVHRRLACVLTDLSLDFVWGTIMPVVVFMPYARLYLSRNEVGATSTVSTESVETEVEQMLVLSLKAFILSIFPFVSASGNIRGIKRLLEQAKSTARPQEENFQPTSEWQSTASQSEGAPHTFQDRLRRNRTVRVIRSYVKVWSLSHLVHALMVLFGVIILGISIASSNFIHRFEATPYDCQRRLRPWLSTKEACAGRVINCTKAGIQGQPAEIMAALEYFDEKTLSSLTFTECSALEFPSTMQRFKNLKALNVYNSAIVGWSEDFALTSSHLPSIQTVRLWYIDLQCSPEGLYRHPLSSSLEWLSLYDIDITGFVDEVGE
ncbi:hypothetical protein Poli38472_000877 [Pythium oligandrum]|uniref:Uncharacterized protein n=1 Tax=Pythium oligandrum TaxID=41045 RepID=A0A8K1CCX6_PYTOL|nr:hypothetical protein Poli38472_000877 [Pythium oligandrum]|eukprot:TMW60835.1 hypothetical protein Poli38472_000877 [Pythium oligandrum]